MNGPADVLFTIPMAGCTFQVPLNKDGRFIPVCQSTVVLNVWLNSTRRTPPGTVESGISTSARALLMLSAIEKLLLQFQRPSRSGVPKLNIDARESANTVSSDPLSCRTGVDSWWNVC